MYLTCNKVCYLFGVVVSLLTWIWILISVTNHGGIPILKQLNWVNFLVTQIFCFLCWCFIHINLFIFLKLTWHCLLGTGQRTNYRRCMRACVLSHFSCIWFFVTPWTVAYQVLLSMEFSRQEYSRGLPCPPPRDLPNPGSNPGPASPALADGFFTFITTWQL